MSSYTVIILFIAGITAGRLFRNNEKAGKKIDTLVTWSVWLLLFLLGISVGINEKIIREFSVIGLKAVILTVGALAGSLFLAKPVYNRFFRNISESVNKEENNK
ncbi:MAG: lysine exporter LysO family protein [Chlorobi bacterium]|nr:lysine exporter LysO family protein [Chlorobiota bacterium]